MWRDWTPLLAFRDPHAVWESEPTFLIAEVVFHVLFLCGAYAAVRGGNFSLAGYAASLAGGAGIELVTIMNSEVGNFYHSQSVLQLFGRHEPVYMLLGCYAWLSFVPIRLAATCAGHLPPLAEAALGGLLLSWLWGTLDMIGMGYMWWTWHHGDPLYVARDVAGVPVASSFWIFSSGVCTVWCLRQLRDRGVFEGSAITSFLAGAGSGMFSGILLMNVPFCLIFHPVQFFGLEADYSVKIFTVVCLILITLYFIANFNRIRFGVTEPGILIQVVFYIGSLCAIVHYFNPKDIVRHSYGQPLGTAAQCALPVAERPHESMLYGVFDRPIHLCPGDITPAYDHFDPSCIKEDPAALGWSSYYTLCGAAKSEAWYHHVWSSLLITGTACILTALVTFAPERKEKRA